MSRASWIDVAAEIQEYVEQIDEPELRMCCDCGDSFYASEDAPGNYCPTCEPEQGIVNHSIFE